MKVGFIVQYSVYMNVHCTCSQISYVQENIFIYRVNIETCEELRSGGGTHKLSINQQNTGAYGFIDKVRAFEKLFFYPCQKSHYNDAIISDRPTDRLTD